MFLIQLSLNPSSNLIYMSQKSWTTSTVCACSDEKASSYNILYADELLKTSTAIKKQFKCFGRTLLVNAYYLQYTFNELKNIIGRWKVLKFQFGILNMCSLISQSYVLVIVFRIGCTFWILKRLLLEASRVWNVFRKHSCLVGAPKNC